MNTAAPQAATQGKALEDLLDDVAASRGAVVFDLDDTLFSTARRHLRILREYAERPRREAKVLGRLSAESLKYSITDTARSAGIDDAGLLEDLRSFWFARFFKNDYLLEDEPLPGAAAYCGDVAAAGGAVVYMTGRDEGMREGTLKALSDNGFPRPGVERVCLVLKPRFDTPDLAFKLEAAARINGLGRVAGAFENEPAHVNLFRDAFPSSRVFFVETKHSGKPIEPHPSAHRIRDFRR